MDVNSINDLFYLSQDRLLEIRVQGDALHAVNLDGQIDVYHINDTFDCGNSASRRIAFIDGAYAS